jgi:hypothetical protein
MSTLLGTTSKASGTRTVTTTVTVRIGARAANSLVEAAETKISKIGAVSNVNVTSLNGLTPKNGNTIVTVKTEITVPSGVGLPTVEETATSVTAIKSVQW